MIIVKLIRNYKYFIVAAIVALLVVVVYTLGLYKTINLKTIREFITSFGPVSALMFILIFSVRTLLVFLPTSVMVVLGGSIFGYFYGSIYSLISLFLCATIAFYISKASGKEFVQKILKNKLKDIDLKIEENGFKIILLMRIAVIFPYDLLSYSAGLTKMRYKDFILGTMLGITPESISLCLLGDNLKKPFSLNFLISVLIVLLVLVTPRVVKKYKKE